MLEERVRRVVRAERSAHRGNDDALRLAIIPDEGHDLLPQIRVEHRLHVAAMKRMRGFVVEAVSVDGVHRVELDFAAIDEFAERLDHALVFEFPFVAAAGRESKQRRAPVAVHHDPKLQTNALGIPALIFAPHCCLLLAAGRESMPAWAGSRQ